MNLREIDRLVATKVLQLKDDTCWVTGKLVWVSDDEDFGFQDDFRPSENIFDAWKVVEKMKDKGFLFALKNTVGGNYSFSLTDWGGMCDTFSADSDTAQLAICLASLKAVGVEVEGEE
jgi:Phage ABA sandwich domain